jgi:hypothetical protein
MARFYFLEPRQTRKPNVFIRPDGFHSGVESPFLKFLAWPLSLFEFREIGEIGGCPGIESCALRAILKRLRRKKRS